MEHDAETSRAQPFFSHRDSVALRAAMRDHEPVICPYCSIALKWYSWMVECTRCRRGLTVSDVLP